MILEAKKAIQLNETEGEISIYQDEPACVEDVAEEYNRLVYAFPNLKNLTDSKELGFMKVFAEAVEFNHLTKRQLHEGTMNVIANKHQYGDLQISDITGYDKKLKLYRYSWASSKDGFCASKLRAADGELWWVRIQDREKANQIWEQTKASN